MAQCFFLLKQFDDVNIYLKVSHPPPPAAPARRRPARTRGIDEPATGRVELCWKLLTRSQSIAPYLREDDSFNYNFGIAQACAGHW